MPEDTRLVTKKSKKKNVLGNAKKKIIMNCVTAWDTHPSPLIISMHVAGDTPPNSFNRIWTDCVMNVLCYFFFFFFFCVNKFVFILLPPPSFI